MLPALTGESYDGMDINNGGDASAQYFYSHIKHELPKIDAIRQHLLKYCCLDTEGMIWIVNKLKELV